MKKIQTLLFFGILILMFSCEPQTKKKGDFKLLPSPQKFNINGISQLKPGEILYYFTPGSLKLPVRGDLLAELQKTEKQSEAQIICKLDSALDMPPEGYTLEISGETIKISGKDYAGLFYGFITLEQLMEDAGEQDVNLPQCRISDYPLLPFRAVHIDVKHHLEKKEYYYKLIDKLAGYKINAIIAEMEDKIAYERQPAVGSSDAMSIDEWKKLSDYAIERNIEISPLIQGLGHASFILKHDRYKKLRDDPESDWAFNPLDPETYEVQFDLYSDAIEATPYCKYLHVGGDEVHTTGRNSGRSALELQLIWLNKVCDFAVENGRTPIFWDDMPLKHANVYRLMYNTKLTEKEVDSIWKENEHKLIEFLDQFPKECIYMRWNYSTPQTAGNKKAMEWFMQNGMKVMGATAGQTRWVLMPQNKSNIDNIRTFALDCIDKKINGILLTLWDDDSPHFELYNRGIVAFAEYCWSGDKRTKDEVKAAYRQREFSGTVSDSEFAFIDRLENPVAFWNNALLKSSNRNRLQKLNDPVNEAIIDLPSGKTEGKWSEKYAKRLEKAATVSQNCDSIAAKIKTMRSQAIRNSYTLEVYEQVNTMVKFTANALLALKTYDMAENKQQENEALKMIKQLPADFEKIRNKFEQVYSKTRILTKPKDYILDQDHHYHLANQTRSFDWQFIAEIMFLKKIEKEF